MDITEQIATLSIFAPQLTHVFVHGSSERQYFALPKFTMDYILKNPKSPELWKKLIQTCKWFFDKNPIVVLPCLHCTDDDVITTCSSHYCRDLCDRPVNLFFKKFMLWITHGFDMRKEGCIDAAKFLIPYIYKCDATVIRLFKQVLTFEEFLFLTDKVVALGYAPSGLQTVDNIPVPFEKIVESLPNIKYINYQFKGNEITDVKKVIEMEEVKKFSRVQLSNIPPTFDIDLFSKFMLENKQIVFVLCFNHVIMPEEYMLKVKTFIKKFATEDYGDYQRPKFLIYHEDVINAIEDDNDD